MEISRERSQKAVLSLLLLILLSIKLLFKTDANSYLEAGVQFKTKFQNLLRKPAIQESSTRESRHRHESRLNQGKVMNRAAEWDNESEQAKAGLSFTSRSYSQDQQTVWQRQGLYTARPRCGWGLVIELRCADQEAGQLQGFWQVGSNVRPRPSDRTQTGNTGGEGKREF